MKNYRECPRRFWFHRIAKVDVRERPSPTLLLGNAIHGALYRFFGLRQEDREPVVERLHQCLRAAWREHRKPGTFPTRDAEKACGERGKDLLANFAASWDTGAKPLARERWVDVVLKNGALLFGKVDRIDGVSHPERKATLDVIDYKTGRVTLEREDVPDEPAAQVYVLATEDTYGRDVERVRFLYLDEGREVSWEPEREDVDAIRERLLELTTRMYSDKTFEANPGDHCSWCKYAHVCPDAGRVELTDLEVDDDGIPF